MFKFKLRKIFNKGFYVGVDMAEQQINVVQVKVQGGQVDIVAWSKVNTTANYLEKNVEELAYLLRQSFQDIDYQGEQVFTALPNKELLIRTTTVPPMSDEELKTAMYYEAHSQLQVDKEKHIIQHMPLNTNGENGQIEVLLIAAPLHQVKKFHQAFKVAGLKLYAIDIYPVALWRSSRYWFNSEPGFGMLHLDGNNTQMVMVGDNQIQYLRPLDHRGKERSLLVKEINRALEIYSYRQVYHPIENIVITGGWDENMSELARYLEVELGLPVNVESPVSPALGAALGLALREVGDEV